ncbi:hypothetical protein FC961_10660 [Clostridium botulinum]|nr:hypothetical protein [Clostridium botulinum]NFO92196.1 hypothetical protein [Clostridium botulinum]
MNWEEIREAKDELIRISNDDEQRQIYEMRSKILKDKISALNKAKKEGIEEGKLEIAKNLKGLLEDNVISEKTGLDLDIIRKL